MQENPEHRAIDREEASPQPDPQGLTWRRAHPLSPLVRAWLVIAVLLVTVGRNIVEDAMEGGEPFSWELLTSLPLPEASWLAWLGIFGSLWPIFFLLVLFAGLMLPYWVGWAFYRFAVDQNNVYVRSGILFKKDRKARLDRVQGIDINRKLGARILGLAELTFDVADGAETALKVEFLSYRDARALRSQLLAQVRDLRNQASGVPGREETGTAPAESAGTPATAQAAEGPFRRDRLAQHLSENLVGIKDGDERELVRVPLGRLLGSMVLSLGWVLGLLFILGLGGAMVWADAPLSAAVASNLALLVALVSSLWSSFNKGFNFRLSTGPDGLKTRYGFTDTTTQTLPQGRVQMVMVHQPLLWRFTGWYRVTVSLAGKEIDLSNFGSALLPVGTFQDLMKVLPLVVPGSTSGGVNEQDLREGIAGSGGERGFTVSPPAARLLDPLTYRRNGFAVSPRLLLVRSGLFNRRLFILPHRKVQELALRQGPLQRWRGLATLELKTAGALNICRVHNADARVARALLVRQAQLSLPGGNRPKASRGPAPTPAPAHSPALAPTPGQTEGPEPTRKERTPVMALELRDGSKAYGKNLVFEGASLRLEPGTYYTLTGPNGSGKSTLMKCLLQQENLTSGELLLRGLPVASSSRDFRTSVFGLNDAIGWLPGITVGQHLEMMARNALTIYEELGWDYDDLYNPREALQETGVPQAYDREAYTLSSGQEQRAKLASLLVRPAHYYFLDEPEKRLDTAGIAWVGEWAQWRVEEGSMVCIATHEPELNQLPGVQNLIFPLKTPGEG